MPRMRALPTSTGRLLFMLLVCAAMAIASSRSIEASTTPTGRLFPNTTTNTTSAAMQVGPTGGMQGAYSTDPAFQAVYTFCLPTADCSQAANWATATFQNNVHEVQLALTPQGNPRMLLTIDNYSQPPANGLYDNYWYAQCDSSCTTSSSWVTTFITGTANIASSLFPVGKHFFALDPQGRPRFVFGPSYGVDSNFNVISWMNYVTCDTACTATGATDPSTGLPIPINWSFGKINATFVQPALAFTAAGQPRLAGFTAANDGQGNDIMNYGECNSACTSSANWRTATVGQPGLVSGEALSLRVNSHDQPRAALYFLSAQARYLWCNSSCTTTANWASVPVVPTQGDGGDPDLQLDKQDRPRVAFHSANPPPTGVGVGLGYASCDTNCEAPTASFRNILADDSSQLNIDWPLVRPANCVTASWLAGYTPVLALDASGNPRIASDSTFVASGCPDGTEDLHTGVRFVYFNQQSTPGSSKVYIPFVKR